MIYKIKHSSAILTLIIFTIIFTVNPFVTSLQVFAQDEDDELKGGEIIPGRYIVILEEPESTDIVARSYQLQDMLTYEYVFNGMAIAATEEQLSQLREDPRVIAIEPDRVVISFAQEIPTGNSQN